MITTELNNTPQTPKEPKTQPAHEKGDVRREPKREFIGEVLMRTACDNCTFTTDSHGRPIIVCTGRCV